MLRVSRDSSSYWKKNSIINLMLSTVKIGITGEYNYDKSLTLESPGGVRAVSLSPISGRTGEA